MFWPGTADAGADAGAVVDDGSTLEGGGCAVTPEASGATGLFAIVGLALAGIFRRKRKKITQIFLLSLHDNSRFFKNLTLVSIFL